MWKRWRENQGRHRKNNDTIPVGAGFDVDYTSSTNIPITIVSLTQTTQEHPATY
jgi:hypothetical protein